MDEDRRLAAAGVGPPPVVGLLAAGAELASFRFRHAPMVPAPRRQANLVALEAGAWRSPPLEVAVTFRQRLRGLRGSPAAGVVLWGRSVHGAGLRRPLAVLHLTRDGRVRGAARLAPGGLVAFRQPGWLVELPAPTPLPAIGTPLLVRPILARCPAG